MKINKFLVMLRYTVNWGKVNSNDLMSMIGLSAGLPLHKSRKAYKYARDGCLILGKECL